MAAKITKNWRDYARSMVHGVRIMTVKMINFRRDSAGSMVRGVFMMTTKVPWFWWDCAWSILIYNALSKFLNELLNKIEPDALQERTCCEIKSALKNKPHCKSKPTSEWKHCCEINHFRRLIPTMTKIQTLKKLVSIVEAGGEEEKQKWVLMSNNLGVKGIDLHRLDLSSKSCQTRQMKKKRIEALANREQKYNIPRYIKRSQWRDQQRHGINFKLTVQGTLFY